MTIVAIRLLGRTGRRPLLLSGTTGMAAGMIVVALTFLIGGGHLHGGAAYIAIAGLLIYFQRQVPETRNRSLQDIERDLGLPGSSIAGTTAQPVAGRV